MDRMNLDHAYAACCCFWFLALASSAVILWMVLK